MIHKKLPAFDSWNFGLNGIIWNELELTINANDFVDSRLAILFLRENERNEPIHINCRKADSEAKYWLDVENFQAIEAHSYNMSQPDKRTVRRIIFEHFDYIVDEWRKFQEKKNG